MSQEEFQKLVLKRFDTIEEGITDLKKDMVYVKDKLRIIEDNAKALTEFKQLIKDSAGDLYKKIS